MESNLTNRLLQKVSQKLKFGRGNITTENIEYIGRVISGEEKNYTLNAQEKQLLHLFTQPYVDLTKDEGEQELAIYILRKAIKKDIEINFLQKLIEGIDLFKKKPELLSKKKTNKKILNSLNIEHYNKHDVLFNIGDMGSVYYIVLKGSINVLIKDPNQKNSGSNITSTQGLSSINEENPKNNHQNLVSNYNTDSDFSQEEDNFQTEREISSNTNIEPQPKKANPGFARSLSMLLKGDFQGQENNDEDFLKKQFPDMICVKTYQSGESFGEIALLTNSKRTATCVAEEDTYLMTLSKQAFDDIMGLYSQQMIEENIGFLKTFSFLKDLPPRKLLALWHLFKEKTLKPRQVLYSENDPVKHLYFVRKGEIQLSKYQQVVKEEQKEHEKIQKARKDQKTHNGLNNISKQKEKKNNYKRQPIVILGANSYFGQEEMLNKQRNRVSQAMTLSESQVYTIEKNKLVQILKYYHQLKIFIKDIKIRSNWHSERVKNMNQARKTQMQITLQHSNKKSQIYQNLDDQYERDPHRKLSYNIEKKLQKSEFIQQRYRRFSVMNNNNINNINNINNNNQIQEEEDCLYEGNDIQNEYDNQIHIFDKIIINPQQELLKQKDQKNTKKIDKSLPSYQLFNKKSKKFGGLEALLLQNQKENEEKKQTTLEQSKKSEEVKSQYQLKLANPPQKKTQTSTKKIQDESYNFKSVKNSNFVEDVEEFSSISPIDARNPKKFQFPENLNQPQNHQNFNQINKKIGALSQSTTHFNLNNNIRSTNSSQQNPLLPNPKLTPQLSQKKEKEPLQQKAASQKHINFQWLQETMQNEENQEKNTPLMSASLKRRVNFQTLNKKKQQNTVNIQELSQIIQSSKQQQQQQQSQNEDIIRVKPRGYSTGNIKTKKLAETQKIKQMQQILNEQRQQQSIFSPLEPRQQQMQQQKEMEGMGKVPRSLSQLTLDPLKPNSSVINSTVIGTNQSIFSSSKPQSTTASSSQQKQSVIIIQKVKKNNNKRKINLIQKQNKENLTQQTGLSLGTPILTSKGGIFSSNNNSSRIGSNYGSVNVTSKNVQRKLNSISEFQQQGSVEPKKNFQISTLKARHI